MEHVGRQVKGRASQIDPPNRFGGPVHILDLAEVEHDEEYLASLSRRATEYIPDRSRSIVVSNDSPDIPFRYSMNPYRGCSHGCAYCFARQTHEYLSLNAGLDFETKILVKEDAPDLLREFLARDAWRPEPIVLAPNTDAYQPGERTYRLTRRCLEVAAEFKQPVSILTKNALVLRDLDILAPMASENLVHVNVSVTTLDADLARSMEPRTSTPAARLRAIRALREAGVPVGALIGPVIPGLNDSEIPAILSAVKEAGAQSAGYVMLRLPLTVAPVFSEWLERTRPESRARIEGRIRSVRGGKLYSAEFGDRMVGTGEMAHQIGRLFKVFARKHGLDRRLPALDCTRFSRPKPKTGQLWLF